MSTVKREPAGFLMRQRAFLKLYLITYVENGRPYGLEMLENIREEFKDFSYRPNHAEIYRSLYDLVDSGIIGRRDKRLPGSTYQEVTIYYIADPDAAKAYKATARHDLDRCIKMLQKAVKDNYV